MTSPSDNPDFSPSPSRREVYLAVRTLPRRQMILFLASIFVFAAGAIVALEQINRAATVEMAIPGGELKEGVVGTPRFVNPLLAASDVDRDLTTLIYSGLLRPGPNGELIPDLAKLVEISEDGLVYTFVLKDDLYWHDGIPLTSADVLFTIQKVQDPLIKSPRRAGWEKVEAEILNDKTIRFTLKQPYLNFLENATLGILPKHLWEQFDRETFSLNQFNIESVGSGPYRVKNIKKNALGIPDHYDLAPFEGFTLGRPKINKLRLKFYPSEGELLDAYRRNEIHSLAAASAANARALEEAGANLLKQSLPRVFGVFFNQNRAAVFAQQEVRQALALAVNRQAIIDSVLSGYGTAADGPLPQRQETATAIDVSSGQPERLEMAAQILRQKGWAKNEETGLWTKENKRDRVILRFSLATADTPELKAAAEAIKEQWETFGAEVELKIFELGDLNQNIIRPRQHEALFFGEVLGRRPDPFVFWHSSQRLDPGLNIALYTNINVDKILEELRGLVGREKLETLYQSFEEEIARDAPAAFVYSPQFLYIIPSEVKNISLAATNTAADRFLNIYQWSLRTDRVWKIFADET